MEGHLHSAYVALWIHQVYRVQVNSDLSVRDVVQAHQAIAGTQQLAPLAHVEGGDSWAVLGRPYLTDTQITERLTLQCVTGVGQLKMLAH